MAFSEDVKIKAYQYLGTEPKPLSVDLAIEQYKDLRNYPDSYTDAKIEADMRKAINKIAMAAVEIDGKDGIEGQVSINDNGTVLNYGNNPIPKAYATVVPFATVF